LKIAAERAGSLDNDAVLAELNKFDKQPLLWGATTFVPDMHIDMFHPMTVIQIQDGKGSFAASIGLDDPPALQLIFPEFTADLYD
jgi:branched-chain amino acid transport system substrate-binding protein